MLGLVCEPERRYEFASVLQDASTGTTRVFLATAMSVVAELALSIKNIKQHIAPCRLRAAACRSIDKLTKLQLSSFIPTFHLFLSVEFLCNYHAIGAEKLLCNEIWVRCGRNSGRSQIDLLLSFARSSADRWGRGGRLLTR